MTPLEAAYLAGFFDGEGSIGIYAYGPKDKPTKRSLLIQVSGSHAESILYIQRVAGGSVIAKRQQHGLGHKPIWSWRATGHRAKAFLREVSPFLVVKRAEAELALLCPVAPTGRYLSQEDKRLKADLARRLRLLKGKSA